MVFMRLGMTNAWRNIARSSLAVLSMMLAAAFLTNAISLSRGYPSMHSHTFRAVLGGEIAVYDLPFLGVIPEGESSWVYHKPISSPFTDLSTFFPELEQRGYLQRQVPSSSLDSPLLAELQQYSGASGVYPRYQIPAEMLSTGFRLPVALRGRDGSLDYLLKTHPQELITQGRWLLPSDEGQYVAVICAHGSQLPEQGRISVGEVIQVAVPKICFASGEPGLDYDDPLIIQLSIVGQIAIPTRDAEMMITDNAGNQQLFSSRLFWQLDELQIPLSTWQGIWTQVADQAFQPEQVMLIVEDLSYIEDTMAELQQGYPQLTFQHVPQLITKAYNQLLIEDLTGLSATAIETLKQTVPGLQQGVMPLDLRMPVSVLIFFNAAMIMIANMLIMVSERRQEIGILKAVGARRREIVIMVISEALVVSLVGAFVGFMSVRIPATLNQILNTVSLKHMLLSVVLDLILVSAMAGVSAVCFGMIPALRMAGSSVNEVFRHE